MNFSKEIEMHSLTRVIASTGQILKRANDNALFQCFSNIHVIRVISVRQF